MNRNIIESRNKEMDFHENQIKIRLAMPKDSDAIARVVKDVYDEYGFGWFPETYHLDLYNLKEHYFDKGDYFWVAIKSSPNGKMDCAEQEICGTIALELFPRIEASKPEEITLVNDYERVAGADCAINRLYVSPKTRRLGIGRHLMARAINQAVLDKKTILEMWSDKRFNKAHRLYKKLGASIVGDRICHDPEQSPEYGFRLDLVPYRDLGC